MGRALGPDDVWKFRKAWFVACRPFINSRPICWPICRGCGKSTTRRLPNIASKHHVRSHSHPAPELAAEGAWLEAPFWIWTADNPRRRRVFVQPRGDDMIVSDLQGLEIPLRLSPESEADTAVAQLAALSGRGIHLRSRALLTTLAARVLLGDLFIHGIGGAKYDRLTDAMIQRFFCLEPPTFLVVSGTLHLPIVHESATTDDLRAVRNRLRELEFHPEVFLDPQLQSGQNNGSGAAHWINEKRHWIAATVAHEDARRRCRAIREANQQLQPYIADRRAELVARGELLSADCAPKPCCLPANTAFVCIPSKRCEIFFSIIPPYAVILDSPPARTTARKVSF